MPTDNSNDVIKKGDVDARLTIEDELSRDISPEQSGGLGLGDVIKAGELSAVDKREEILSRAVTQATAIRDKAKRLYAKVEDVIRNAHTKGYESGREEGLASVTQTLLTLKSEHARILEGLEKEAVNLVYEIARKIIGESFRTDDDALTGMVRQALNASMGEHLTVFLSPSDYQRIKEQKSQLFSAVVAGVKSFTLKPMESVKAGSCVIESDMGTVEADLEKQLAAISRALGLEKEG